MKAYSRVVSLVPSITETFFDLGLGEKIVGITDYCIYPAEKLSGIPRINGPKDADFQKILFLEPDLVVANQEENCKETILGLQKQGIDVLLFFPKTVSDVLEDMWKIAELFNNSASFEVIRNIERTLDWVQAAAQNVQKVRYFCPIWQGVLESGPYYWMTFNKNTYSNDLLSICGGENCFENRRRKYPIEADLGLISPEANEGRDDRYPRIAMQELIEANPELIILPSEPYSYSEKEISQFEDILKRGNPEWAGRILNIDGSLITWSGTRLAKALDALPELF